MAELDRGPPPPAVEVLDLDQLPGGGQPGAEVADAAAEGDRAAATQVAGRSLSVAEPRTRSFTTSDAGRSERLPGNCTRTSRDTPRGSRSGTPRCRR